MISASVPSSLIATFSSIQLFSSAVNSGSSSFRTTKHVGVETSVASNTALRSTWRVFRSSSRCSSLNLRIEDVSALTAFSVVCIASSCFFTSASPDSG